MIKRVLCLDVGEKRIGVAVSDPLGLTAQGVETIFTKGPEKDRARVRELAALYETDRILAGLPRSMDGTVGFQAQRVMAFTEPLGEMGLTVRYEDERLTSAAATRTLIEGSVRRDKRKQVIDKLAATYILQSFLDAGGWREEEGEKHMSDEEKYTEEGSAVVELVDEDGKTVRFEHLYTIPHEGDEYVVLVPLDEVEGVEDDELMIMRIEQGEDEDTYVGIEDEELLETIFEKYLELAEADEEADEAFEDAEDPDEPEQ